MRDVLDMRLSAARLVHPHPGLRPPVAPCSGGVYSGMNHLGMTESLPSASRQQWRVCMIPAALGLSLGNLPAIAAHAVIACSDRRA